MRQSSFVSTAAIALLLMVFSSCSKSGSSYGSGNNNNTGGNTNNGGNTSNAVSIVNMSFSKSTLQVAAGTTVTWTNNDNMAHTVTADDSSFDSGNIAVGATYRHTFSQAGTFAYHCSYHSGMTGTVSVN